MQLYVAWFGTNLKILNLNYSKPMFSLIQACYSLSKPETQSIRQHNLMWLTIPKLIRDYMIFDASMRKCFRHPTNELIVWWRLLSFRTCPGCGTMCTITICGGFEPFFSQKVFHTLVCLLYHINSKCAGRLWPWRVAW